MNEIEKWTSEDIPDLTGKIIAITGANSGLGLEATRILSGKNAQVIMGCRNSEKAGKAMEAILNENPASLIEYIHLNLADLSSIKNFIKEFKVKHKQLNYLFNNAGVMAIPKELTVDGFEMQMGTNHLGHFALTGQILDLILQTENSRIITTSSIAHKFGKIKIKDLNSEKRYHKLFAYCQSKLANLLFAYELQRRLDAIRSSVLSVASHPGFTHTNLSKTSAKMESSGLGKRMLTFVNSFMAQDVKIGVLPMLMAAFSNEIKGGEYTGPSDRMEQRGYPKIVKSSKKSHDKELAMKLWDLSEQLTGIKFPSFFQPP